MDKSTFKAGEDVTVTVNFNEDLENVSGLALNLHFNSNLFTYKEGQAFDEYAVIVKGEEGTAPDQYKVINWLSFKGVGTIKAGKYATCTFTAKENIADLTTAEFVAKVDMDETTMVPGYADPTYPDSKISVTVTPASTEPEGYAVAASAVNSSITVKEDAQVALKISNNGVTTYNAYYMEVSYDAAKLTYKSVTPADATIIKDETNGTLKIAGYGADKTCGTDNIVLTFTGKAIGKTEVTVDVKANAAEKDAPAATITAKEATITVGGYQVSLPDGFTGEGTANPGEDYTFTAKDKDKKYDFSGSTMGDEPVKVIDNGNGTYTVKNVSGKLVIKATEKVAINLSGDAVNTIVNKSWGEATEVDAGKELSFTAQLEPGKELVVTVNSQEVKGSSRPGAMLYTITADQVTGTELNIVVNYKAADKATIIESGTAWSKVSNLSRVGWTKSGDKVDAGTTLDFFFKPETGKTIDDYVIRANGADCMYTKVGGRYKVEIPRTIITAGATVTIYFDYAATPEPTITVNVSEYLKLDNQSIFLITASCTDLAEGKVLAYNGNPMYWSSKYNKSNGAYAWLVISTDTLETVKAAATTDKFTVIEATDSNKISIAYDGDVNQTTRVDINDAQLVWNMYKAEYSNFDTVNIRKFLEADMNGDETVSVLDATVIVNNITK